MIDARFRSGTNVLSAMAAASVLALITAMAPTAALADDHVDAGSPVLEFGEPGEHTVPGENAVPNEQPALSTPVPTILGVASVGATLTAEPGEWTSGVSLTYQWLRNGTAIPGATGAAYTVIAIDAGAALSVVVSGALDGYDTASMSSLPTEKVATAGAVTRTGTLAVGAVQTAVPGVWATGTAFAYQWLRDGQPIAGATKATYTLVAADAGAQIAVAVTGTKVGYATVTKSSAASARVASAPVPKITGTVVVGSTVTAVPGAWAAGTAFAYQWMRGATAIAGATKPTYKLATADAGAQIAVRVTGSKAGFATVMKASAASTRTTTAATPKVTGTARFGSTLTATTGTWTKATRFTYQWMRAGTAIKGATASSYKLTASDVGKPLTVAVTGRLAGYTTVTKTSAATAKIAAAVLTAGSPKITGTASVSSTLTAQPGSWTSGSTLKYQWLRNGAAIGGATAKTYKVRPTDAYAKISVKVTGSKSGYGSVSKTTAALAPKGKVYANCTLLNAAYPDGIRKDGVKVDRKAGVNRPLVGNPYASTALYNLQSIARDADRDGIMCER